MTQATGSWLSFVSSAFVLPLLLWLTGRCQPAFGTVGASFASIAIISATTFGIGRFGDAAVPITDCVAGAQLAMMTVTLFTLVLAVLFAQRKEAERTLFDRNRQLELAGKRALVGRFAIEIDVAREDFSSQRIQFSPGLAAIYGLPEETVEISVGDWRSVVHPDDLPQFVEHRKQLIAERRGEHHAEHRIVRPGGTIRWIETCSFFEYDQAGRAKRIVGVNIDITERKQAELALAERNAQLAMAGQAVLIGSYAYDPNLEMIRVSPKAIVPYTVCRRELPRRRALNSLPGYTLMTLSE